MIISTPLSRQLALSAEDAVRVLIVGAGVAGLALAQILRAQGRHPVLLERAAPEAADGYMLALMPMVIPALEQMGALEAWKARSVRFHEYVLHGRHGKTLRRYRIDSLLGCEGDYRGISRSQLLQAMAWQAAPVTHQSSVEALSSTEQAVRVRMRSGSESCTTDFDVVVVADGMHSGTRSLLLPKDQVETRDSGWGGWLGWMDVDAGREECGDEWWGSDFMLGVYPVPGKAGIFLGAPTSARERGAAAMARHARKQLRVRDAVIERALAVMEQAEAPYYWPLTDCRCATWSVGRVALLGDAAAGFLPTAGVGAGMAMESAFVLARHLLPACRAEVAQALCAYERVQRPRVEAAQDNSRQLARWMFRDSRLLAFVRDQVMRVMSLKAALGPIRELLDAAPSERGSSTP